MRHNYINNADNFCYICGDVPFARQTNVIIAIVKKTYHLYFGCKIDDQGNPEPRTYAALTLLGSLCGVYGAGVKRVWCA